MGNHATIFSTNVIQFRKNKKKSVFGWVSANVDPILSNSAPKSPTFGAIANINPTGMQWKGLAEF